MMPRPHGIYTCGAGVNHYERASKIEKWKRNDQERIEAEARAKVRAHDDYMAGMALFRQRATDMLAGLRYSDPPGQNFAGGYERAIRDMDRALLDAVAMRGDGDDPR
jgi:hypothetical protein